MRSTPIGTQHVPIDTLAAFAEGALGEISRARVHAHIRCCDRCSELYEYAVRHAWMTEEGAGLEAIPDHLIAAAERVVPEPRARRTRTAGPTTGMREWLRRPAGRFVLAPALIAMFVLAVWWFRPVGTGSSFNADADWLLPVTTAMTEAPHRYGVVIPGVEDRLTAASAATRAGHVVVGNDLDTALAELAARYDAGTITADEMQWLIGGYLAAGLYANAHDYAVAARNRFPGNQDLLVMDALAARGIGQLERSRSLLEEVVRREPNDAVAHLDLAVVLSEMGQRAAAETHLRRAIALSEGDALAPFAESLARDLFPAPAP